MLKLVEIHKVRKFLIKYLINFIWYKVTILIPFDRYQDFDSGNEKKIMRIDSINSHYKLILIMILIQLLYIFL